MMSRVQKQKPFLFRNDFSSQVVKLVTSFLRCAIRYHKLENIRVANISSEKSSCNKNFVVTGGLENSLTGWQKGDIISQLRHSTAWKITRSV